MIKLKTIDFHITNKCNLSCKHCLYSSGKEFSNELTTQEIYNLVDDFFNLSNGTGTINIYGGEALLRNDIIKILSYILGKGLNIGITSNFYNIKKDVIGFLLKSNISRFTLNIDGGNFSSHDWLRNKKNHFTHTLESIKLLNNHNKKVSLNCVLHKNNANEINDILKLANKFKIESISFYLFTDLGRGKMIKELVIGGKEWLKIKLKVIKWIYKNKPDFLVIWESSYINKIDFSKDYRAMCEGKDLKVINIGSNGSVHFCGLLLSVDGNSLGNIRDDKLETIISRREQMSYKNILGCPALNISRGNSDEYIDEEIIPICPYEQEAINNKTNNLDKFAHITIK